MKAEITDSFDLILRWDNESRSQITWSACSSCEFDIVATLWVPPGCNYQGASKIELRTTCYAFSLRCFADDLVRFVAGDITDIEYTGSDDLRLMVRKRKGQCDYKDRSIVACDLQYDFFRAVDHVACDSKLNLTLGILEDPAGCSNAIRSVIETLDIDDSYDAPSKQ
ncbi:hypothetical protein NT6N_24250 [Oceaniferula spumae]|uniref:Uncharacterized protein n=1 Tax=Oceaniferula spumae TaxID=2979115 RepID=A0AAT9FN53_9BACT